MSLSRALFAWPTKHILLTIHRFHRLHPFTSHYSLSYVHNSAFPQSQLPPYYYYFFHDLTLFVVWIGVPMVNGDDLHLLPPLFYGRTCSKLNILDRPLRGALHRSSSPTTLIVYNFYASVGADDNFAFFLEHALHSRSDTHFLIVLSDMPCIPIPRLPNLGVMLAPNSCYGFSAIQDAIERLRQGTIYEQFLILGSWVRGPFMPSWSDECWNDAFTRHLNITQVKMTGTTHSCHDADGKFHPHFHSTVWAFKRDSAPELLKPFSCKSRDMSHSRTEQTSSVQIAHVRGWNVASLDPGWRNYSASDHCGNDWNYKPHPYETIFVNPRLHTYVKYFPSQEEDFKNSIDYVQLSTDAVDLRGYNSQQVCK
jgi:hypothetical protein